MWSLICVFPANTLSNQPSAKSSLVYTVQQNAPEKMAVAENFYYSDISLVSVGLWAMQT